jgi:hypothetical protein
MLWLPDFASGSHDRVLTFLGNYDADLGAPSFPKQVGSIGANPYQLCRPLLSILPLDSFSNEARHRYAVLILEAESTYLMSSTSLPISL